MVFPTIEFAVFFAVVLTVSWLLMPTPAWWKPFMLAVSLFFYGFVDAHWVLLLGFSIVANCGMNSRARTIGPATTCGKNDR